FLELQSNFKSHALRALVERRALEKDLARLKYPDLYQPELDIVADIHRSNSRPQGHGCVSVVITNFNYGLHLARTLHSVAAQDYGDIEVVVVDDSSTDGSPVLVGQLLTTMTGRPTQAVLLRHNVGLPTARNIGIKAARGEFVFTLDADNHLLAQCVRQHV